MSSSGPAVDSSGNLKDASEIVFYNSESDEVPLPILAGPTGERCWLKGHLQITYTDVDFFFIQVLGAPHDQLKTILVNCWMLKNVTLMVN